MKTYFRTKITTKIKDSYKEEYYLGIEAEDWNCSIAEEFISVWLDEQEKEIHNINPKYEKYHGKVKECTASQYRKSYIKLNDSLEI